MTISATILPAAAALICAALGQGSPDCHIASEGITTVSHIINNSSGSEGGYTTYHSDRAPATITLDDHDKPVGTIAALWEHEITHVKDSRQVTFAFTHDWCIQSETHAYTAQLVMFQWVVRTFGRVAGADYWSFVMTSVTNAGEAPADFAGYQVRQIDAMGQCHSSYGFAG